MSIFRVFFLEFRTFYKERDFPKFRIKKCVPKIFFPIFPCILTFYFVPLAPKIYVTWLSFFGRISSMLNFFSVYSIFIFLSAGSECTQQSDTFCRPSRFQLFVFRKFPDIKVLSWKVLRFVSFCETEERGLRYDLSDLKVAIVVFQSCIANAKKSQSKINNA